MTLAGRLLLVSALVSGLVLVGVPAQAAVFVVSKKVDTNDGVCNADCSLREAVIAANAAAGADVIRVPAGRYVLTIAGTDDTAAAGDLDVNSTVTLVSTGGTAIIDGGGTDRVIHVGGSGSLTVRGLRITGGLADQATGGVGGGVFVAGGGAATVVNSTVAGNRARCGGGGILNLGTMTLNASTVSDNAVAPGCPNSRGYNEATGGGISNVGTLTINRATVTANFAGTAPCPSCNRAAIGGGIYNVGTLSVAQSTVSANHLDPPGYGGGIFGLATLTASLLADNGASLSPDCTEIASGGHNLIEDATGCAISGDATGNIIGVDPGLGPLRDNGGPTFTRAIGRASPAVGAGPPAGSDNCGPADQRGVPRPQGQGCDVGAYELAFCGRVRVNRVGTPGHDILRGTPGPDGVLAFGGSDTITTGGGNDAVCAGGGNDVVDVGAGSDHVDAGAGNDTVKGGTEDDEILGGDGVDELRGGPGADLVRGGPGADALYGATGDDALFGQAGDDYLNGGPDSDLCHGGVGEDRAVACERRYSIP